MPDPDIHQIISELQVWAREEHGRQRLLAAELGVSFQAVSKWVRGKCLPSWEAGEKIRKFMAEQKRKKKPKDKPAKKPRGKPGRPRKVAPEDPPL